MDHSSGNWDILADKLAVPHDATPASTLHPLAGKLLALRGITGEKTDLFLNPTLAHLPSPDGLHGLKAALELLVDALEKNIPVVIYGDYDADGITATALLSTFMEQTGFICTSYIPDRLTEGYSLNCEALAELKKRHSREGENRLVLITVDCGISNHQEVDEARAMGYSVIITDHHRTSGSLPDADAVINPQIPDCEFPFKELAGVGVAFYLIAGLRARLMEAGHWQKGSQPNLREYLDFVALGTVADMVPLTGTNRILVKAGLEMIRKSTRPGIKALLKKANLNAPSVSAESISFQLAPRLNAAGRTGNPLLALELLTATDNIEAEGKASLLEEANIQRRAISDEIYVEACIVAEQQLTRGDKGLVLARPGWHKGMLGLVASRIAGKYNHPTIIFTIDDDGIATGSGRSAYDLDIHAILEKMSNQLIRFGGHRAAVGLSISSAKIDDFRRRFTEAVALKLPEVELEQVLEIDTRASFQEVFDPLFLEIYKKMEPFGFGNPQPVFCHTFKAACLMDLKKIGDNSIRFKFDDKSSIGKSLAVDCVGFGKADFFQKMNAADSINMAFKITFNEYRGISKWEARVEDIIINSACD